MKINKSTVNEISVYADWLQLKGTKLMGRLFASQLRGKEIFQFEYDADWLKSPYAAHIDPELNFFAGRQYPSPDQQNFGVFLDSMPDRWGRQLMLRRESISARLENRKPKTLYDSDFLLGVDDAQRLGALRFKIENENEFANSDPTFSTPPWASLRDLELASINYEKSLSHHDPETIKWLNMLLAPGSSLGGARPKAGVKDVLGNLWIAKFPSKNDEIDTGAWEMVVNRLASLSGINVADGLAIKFTTNRHTYLSKRFDRNTNGDRIHFSSAMTMLGHKDGDDYTTGASYLEMIPFFLKHGANPQKNLEELWRRIVFSVLVKNTDDHLRNHGFLLTKKGWVLSPAYDINPNPYGSGLRLNISENDNSLDLDLVLSVCNYFRLSSKKARVIIIEITKSISTWKNIANEYQVSAKEVEMMADIFEPV